MRHVTDELVGQARDFTNQLTREERGQIFSDRMLEEEATNARYRNGQSVKETVDTMLLAGGTPSFSRADTLGRKYAKMAVQYLSNLSE
jgi:coproporphyrinogen III oxidase-like Fe-S oxidoreductase